MELLGDTIHHPASLSCQPACGSFKSFYDAFRTLFFALTGSGWARVMYQAMQDNGDTTLCIFFISYIMASYVILLQLLSALVLEVFGLEMEKAIQAEGKKSSLKVMVLWLTHSPGLRRHHHLLLRHSHAVLFLL